jgi:aryl-alcohol dehydrogenase-like predicted oxidoreductase
MDTVTLGQGGPPVSRAGLGLMGMSSGATARDVGPADPRTRFPRFSGENLQRNLTLLDALEAIAARRGATAAQLAIAWVASRGDDIIPLIGTKRRERLAEALGAFDLTLTPDELAAIASAVPARQVAGDRYDPRAMASLDSEH